jgi:hypothetical protein
LREAADLFGFWTYLLVMGAGAIHGEAMGAAYDLATTQSERLPPPRQHARRRATSARAHQRLTARYASTSARSLASIR